MSLREEEDLQSWRRVVAAAYIPTNKQNLLRQDIAAEMGLDTTEGAVVVLYWKLAHSQKAYKYKNDFNVKLELPCQVIFGKQSKMNRLDGFPTPFEKGKNCRAKYNFDESYDFSQKRTNSWERLKETFSRGPLGSSERKDKPRRLSFLQKRKSQRFPNSRDPEEAEPSQATGTGAQAQEVEEGVSHQNATEGANGEWKIESTAKLPAEKSTENQNRSSQSRNSKGLVNQGVSDFRSVPSETKTREKVGDRDIDPRAEKSQDTSMPENPDRGISQIKLRDKFSLEPSSKEVSGQEVLERNQSQRENEEVAANLTALRVVENSMRFDALGMPLLPPESGGNEEERELPMHSQNITPDLTNEPDSSLGVVENIPPSQFAIETRARNAGKLQQWKVSELKLENDTVSQPSTTYAESSSDRALNPAATPDSPLSQGKFTSLLDRYPERVLDNTLQKDSSPDTPKNIVSQENGAGGGNDSGNMLSLLKQQDAQAKIRARKRGKAPKIRRVKLDPSKTSENVEMTAAPGASEDWTYDASSKGHWHIDSDTGSTIWYSDAESEQSDV